MAKINDGMRGTWNVSGKYWHCDCGQHVPLLNIHFGQGGSRTDGKAQSPNVSRCNRCQILRPLQRDRPELGNVLPLGIKRAQWKDGRLQELDDSTHR